MGKPENSVRFITSDGNRVADEDTAETVSLQHQCAGVLL